MQRMFMIFLLLVSLSAPSYASFKNELHLYTKNTHTNPLTSYRESRKILFGDLHYKRGEVTEVYCDKTYDSSDGVGKNKIPNHQRLNCEHTHPQSKFNSRFSKSIQKSDLHHLYPSFSKANSTRSNLPFGNVNGSPVNDCSESSYGTIEGTHTKGFEPPLYHKGNVARAMFYFSVRYDIAIDEVQERFLREWHIADPIDEDETIRNNKIAKIQGNYNPFIVDPTLVDQVTNF